MATLFISDLHLSGERPDISGLFVDFLQHQAAGTEALYILGDLFEVWLGDDLILPEYHRIVDALRQLSDAGTRIYIMRGNRDFLMGPTFAALSGCHLIEDPTVISLYGESTLLMHGDTLCTDDHAYQAMRQQLRDPDWVEEFLAKPPEARIAFARELRERSQRETGSKEAAIMDVNPQTVAETMARHRVRRLIHGHTHRPGVHRLQVEGQAAERLVIGDWYEQGSVLRCTPEGCALESVSA